jgi:GNAT superfamily N-acetyltransferase
MTEDFRFTVKLECPLIEEFIQLRLIVGWDELDKNLVKNSLANSLFHVVIRNKTQLIAMGRVVGDGAMYFYIQDIIVDPNYQNLGLGTIVMDNIEEYLTKVAKTGSTIGLLSAKGKESFYSRYGYITRPNLSLGNGMCRFVKND